MKEILKKAKSHKFNSLQYVDLSGFDNLGSKNIISNFDYTVLIKEDSRQYQLYWGAEDKESFIVGIKDAVDRVTSFQTTGKRIYVEFIPPEFVNILKDMGFKIVSEWVDYFLNGLQQITIPEPKYTYIRHINENEYNEASCVTKVCRGYSREFYGEEAEFLKEWSEDANSCIFVAHDQGKIIGLSMMNIYGHQSEKGPIVWLRELAVHPEYHGRGIGYSLILEGLKWGKTHKATRSYLAVDTENHSAIKLYETLGYKRNVDRGQINMAR